MEGGEEGGEDFHSDLQPHMKAYAILMSSIT
jgi:hypothetical protein